MEPKGHHILIGLFTVIAGAGALMFALWLGQATSDRDYNYYDVGFDRAVSGLAVGNAVLYSGIKVGDVLSLDFDEDDPRLVRARVRVFEEIPITEDTRATLELANITGQMSIQLTGGSPDSPRLEGDRDSPPLIRAEPSPLSNLLSNGESILQNLNELLENANKMFSEQNTENLTQIVSNLKVTTDTLANQRGELSEGITQLNQLLTDANRLTQRVDGLVDGPGREMLDSANRTLSTLDQMVTQNQGALEQGLDSVNDLGPALRELRSTLNAVQQMTRSLEESPRGLLFGRDQIKEFNP